MEMMKVILGAFMKIALMLGINHHVDNHILHNNRYGRPNTQSQEIERVSTQSHALGALKAIIMRLVTSGKIALSNPQLQTLNGSCSCKNVLNAPDNIAGARTNFVGSTVPSESTIIVSLINMHGSILQAMFC
ncbi:hypothetical protein KG892_03240 [Vermiphilus pyriformis]|uniref:Uncharacterized protein n=1 Tax=candidate division TM6 bacterium JCVI TM6SC1 TaxID=1306947 RepID=A0A0D2JD91_9BACT|nr:hypothetical protein J120_04315 [candidate division TM6 bacterium JCVI TM6SC1]UNE34990.1 MAG: hypothetical protein KG892_03240 [Vermiphilus pyriformis]